MQKKSGCCCKKTCKPEYWFYYSDSNNDDIQMLVREIKDPMFCPIGFVGSKTGFASNSNIVRRFLAQLNVRNLPVANGYSVPISGPENLQQGILNYSLPIRQLTDTLWGAADQYNLPSADNIPLSVFPSHILLRKAILRALRTRTKFGIRITGPSTDIALDLRSNEDLPLKDAIFEIRYSGGAVDVHGNLFTVPTNTYGEFNIYLDPKAFIDVLSIANRHGILVRLIPLDATNDCPINRQYFYSCLLPETFVTTEGKAMGQLFVNVKNAFGDETFFNDAGIPGGGYYQWDAHSSNLDEITKWECNFYNVETTPLIPTSGWLFRTSCDKGYPMRVAMGLNCQSFRKKWKPIFDSPYSGNLKCNRDTIEIEPLVINPCNERFLKYTTKIVCEKKDCKDPESP